MRKYIAAAALAVIATSAGGTAFAGEIGGSGKPTQGPAHANSICVYSGLEDGGDFPGQPAGPGVTQSWGQIPKAVRDVLATEGEHPGDACNGHTGFFAGGGTES